MILTPSPASFPTLRDEPLTATRRLWSATNPRRRFERLPLHMGDCRRSEERWGLTLPSMIERNTTSLDVLPLPLHICRSWPVPYTRATLDSQKGGVSVNDPVPGSLAEKYIREGRRLDALEKTRDRNEEVCARTGGSRKQFMDWLYSIRPEAYLEFP